MGLRSGIDPGAFAAIATALLQSVLAHQLLRLRVRQWHVLLVPLNGEHVPDVARWRAVVRAVDLELHVAWTA